VNSAVFQSAGAKSGDGFLKQLIANFTMSPIIEYSSGRPFNVITGSGYSSGLRRVSGSAFGWRGHVVALHPGVTFGPPTCVSTAMARRLPFPWLPAAGCIGNLGRNRFTSPNFFQVDMRVSRRIPLGERFKIDVIADAFKSAQPHQHSRRQPALAILGRLNLQRGPANRLLRRAPVFSLHSN